MQNRPLLYVIDGNSYIYRAFFAIPPLKTSAGFPTNAIYGFVKMLLSILKEKKPDYLAVAFDPKGPTHRTVAYSEYKSHRPPMPDGLIPQISYIHEIVRAFNIPLLLEEGFEADDLLGTCAKKAGEQNFNTVIITGDKDMLQLVSPHVSIYDPMKDKMIDEEGVISRFGVGPDKVIEVMGLMGDASDNIPGVPGIGEKTAVKLIKEYGSIEGLLNSLDRMKPSKLQENLNAHAEMARLSRKLATIDLNAPFPVEIEAMKVRRPDRERVKKLFSELEFFNLLKNLEGDPSREIVFDIIRSSGELHPFLEKVKEAGEIILFPSAIRSEGEGEKLAGLGVGICRPLEETIVFLNGPSLFSGEIKEILEDPGIKKIGHDLKSIFLLFEKEGIRLEGIYFDTMIASYLIHPNHHRHTLDEIALEHLQVSRSREFEKNSPFDPDQSARFASEAVDLIGKVRPLLSLLLEKFSLNSLFSDLEIPLIAVLAGMESAGIKLDVSLLEALSKELDIQLQRLVENIFLLAGESFNINSPKQLAEILFERLKLKPGKKTKTGFSTDEGVLSQLALQHELPAEILNYRQLTKLKSTYVDALPRLVRPATGRLHTTFNQVVTATGRLSSSDPNLQNIPVRGEWGMRVREAFIADERWKMISADYNQIELRILAHLSQDRQLIQSFREGEDIHRRTAAQIFQVAPDRVTREMRRAGKTINFGIIYGMGPFSLASDLGITLAEAKKYIENYFACYQGVKSYIDRTVAEVREKGYVTTLLNRRRLIPELNSPVASVRSFGERLAINTPIQGSAADLIKLAMVSIGNKIRGSRNKIKMVLQIHDELLFEAAESELEASKRLIQKEMEEIIKLTVPITVDIGVGKNWREAH